jgi:2-dehydropantoate 2-reductase
MSFMHTRFTMIKEHTLSTSSSPLRIAVVGLGGIGSTFAFQLARIGHHEVTVVARPGSARLLHLQRDQAIVNVKGERAEVLVADALDEQTPYDLVLVTLLAHQVAAVLPRLQRSSAKWIQFMFNNFEPEILQDAIGAGRCSFGMPFVQATVTPDGKLNATIGAAGQKTKMNDRRWVELFVASGMPAVLEPDMLLWLRCHAPMGAAFESISVAGVRRGGGASWGEAMVVASGLKESFTLIERLGYKLYPSGKSLLHASPTAVASSMLWSMSRIKSFRELLATGINECRALVDVMAENATRAQPSVSVAKIQAMKPADTN